MEATLIGVPRIVSAQADEQSKTAATIINLSCITSIQGSISMTTNCCTDVACNVSNGVSYIGLISCNICGSIFPPLMIATFTVVFGNWS